MIQLVYSLVKIIITVILIIAISEVSKRNSLIAALLASLPLTSILAMIWIYEETQDTKPVSELANSVFWLVIPSLVLFVSLPVLLRCGLNFYLSLGLSTLLTAGCYGLMVIILSYFGIKL